MVLPYCSFCVCVCFSTVILQLASPPSLILLQQLLLLRVWRSSLHLPSLLLMMPLPSQWSGYFMRLPTYVTPIRESPQHLLCNTFSVRPSTLRSSGGTAGPSLEEECSRTSRGWMSLLSPPYIGFKTARSNLLFRMQIRRGAELPSNIPRWAPLSFLSPRLLDAWDDIN